MELKDYARILLKRGWIIALVCLVTAVSAIAFSKMQTKIYRSSTKLLVEPARNDYGQTLASKNMLRAFTLRIQTPAMAREVIDELELDISPQKLLDKVTVSAIQEDLAIQIDADDPDPNIAQAIAGTLAHKFVEDHQARSLDDDKRDRIDVIVLYEAKPAWVHWPRTKPLALAGAILGVLLGGIVALGLEYLEADVIRSSDDVDRYVGVPVLGSIPTITVEEAKRGQMAQRRRFFSLSWLSRRP